jgi:hypothetical protein
MTDLSRITRQDSFGSSDNVLVYSSSANDARLIPYADFVAALAPTTNSNITQYYSPSSTGFSVSINDSYQDVWLILQPTGTLAAGSLVLPSSANVIDNQEIIVSSTNQVTTLTISGNGSTVTGAPSTIAANGYFKLKYNSTLTTWYRVG